MTFDEFKAKYDKAPFTEEQKELMYRFNQSVMALRDMVLTDSNDERLNEFGEYMDALGYLTEDPDSFASEESKAEWEKNWNKAQGLQRFLQQDDNFKHIMSLIGGKNPIFGSGCEVLFGMMDLMLGAFGIYIDAEGWRKEYEFDQPSLDEPETEEPKTDGPETERPETEGPETDGPETEGPETDGPETEEPEVKEPEKTVTKNEKRAADIKRYRGDKLNALANEFKINQGKNLTDFPADVLNNAGLTDSRLHSNNVIFDLFVMTKHNVEFKDIPKFERGELEGHDKSKYLAEFRTFLEEHPISKPGENGERVYIPENAKVWGEFYRDVDKKLSEYRLPEVDLGNPDTFDKHADEIVMLNKIGTDLVQVVQDHQMEKFRVPELNAAFVEGFGSVKAEMNFWANCTTLQNIKSMMGAVGIQLTNDQVGYELNQVVAGRWFTTQNKDLYQGKTLQEYRKNIPFVPSLLAVTAQKQMSSYSPEERQAIEAFLEKGTPLPKKLADSFAQSIDIIKTDIFPSMVADEVKGELDALINRGVLDKYVNELSVGGDPAKIPDVKNMTPEQRNTAEKCYDHIIFSSYNIYFSSCNMADMNMEPNDLIRINGTPLKKFCKENYGRNQIFGEGRKWSELKPEEQERYMKMETARAMLDPAMKLECYTLVPDAEGKLSVSKTGAVTGKFNAEANKKLMAEEAARKEKEKRDREREIYRNRRKGVLKSAGELYKPFIDIYGPDGKLPRKIGFNNPEEYDKIKLEVPEGLDELTVTAIVIGATMDPKYMTRASSSSTAIVGSMLENNQMHLVNNVVKGDGRETRFAPLMIEARQEVKEALEAYKSGDKTKVTQMLQNYVNYCASAGNTAAAGGANLSDIDIEKQAYMLGQYILDNEILGIKEPKAKGCTEINSIRLKSYGKQMEAFISAERSKMDLMDHFADIDKNTRDSMIADILFDTYISAMALKQEKNRLAEQDVHVSEAFRAFGVDPSSDEYVTDISPNVKIINASNKMQQFIQAFTLTDFDAIMAKPGGYEQIKSLYMEEIKKSDTYKKLTGAVSADDFTDRLIEAGNDLDKGITSIEKVKLPEESKPYNEKYSEIKGKAIRDVMNEVMDAAFNENDIWADEVEEYGLNSLNPEDVRKHAGQISALYNEMEALDDRRSPQSFKDLLEQLKNIRDITQKNAGKGSVLSSREAVAYKRAVEKFESLASKYFDGAAKEGSEAERAEKVAKIRRHINAGKVPVTDAISKMEEQVSREIFGEQRKLLNGLNPKQSPYLDVFFGEKYKDQRTRTASQYSLERSAGVSVAIFALFNTGKYSFDDIMDPEKLQAEKRAMFDEVAQRMLNPTSENQEWLARTIYEGQKNTERAIDEQAKQVDFSTVDIATDKRFCQMLHLASAQFDAWQEMSHCQDEITKIANAERPEIKSYKDYYDWWTDRRGPLGLINDALEKIEEHAIDLVTNPDSVEEPLRNVVGEYVSMKNYMQAISEAMITGEKSFTESLSGDRILEEREKNLYIGEQIGKYSKKFKGLYYAARDVLDSVVSDTYLFGKEIVVDLEAGKAELKGFPGPEELKRRNQLVKADSIQAATRFENIGKDAKAATVGVYFGSKQYSDAMRDIDKVHVAFKELQEIENKRIDAANNSETQEDILQEIERQKEAKKTEIRGLMSNAKKSIEKYFDRKRKRGEMGPKADAKSKRRIGVMQDAMSAIEEYTLQLDAEDMVDENEKMLSTSDTAEPEFENLQQILVETRKSEYMSKLTDAVGIDRIAKKGALQAISTLEELTNLDSEFGTKEIRTARIAMAAMVFDEMMSGPEGDKIRENMSGDLKTYKAQVTKIADSKEFKDVMPKNLSREGIRDFLIYESKAKELLDSFKVKTAETAAKKQNEPEKGRKSVATQQKPENEPAQRKRSNSVSVKMTAKIP